MRTTPRATRALTAFVLDFRNNVVYELGFARCACASGGPIYSNYINNYFKPGPSTRKSAARHTESGAMTYPAFVRLRKRVGELRSGDQDNALLVEAPDEFNREEMRNLIVVTTPFPVRT